MWPNYKKVSERKKNRQTMAIGNHETVIVNGYCAIIEKKLTTAITVIMTIKVVHCATIGKTTSK